MWCNLVWPPLSADPVNKIVKTWELILHRFPPPQNRAVIKEQGRLDSVRVGSCVPRDRAGQRA